MSNWYKSKTEVEQENYERKVKQIRSERDKLLKETDYIVLPNYPLEDKTEWQTYRQELQDIIEQEGFPGEVVWSEKPEV